MKMTLLERLKESHPDNVDEEFIGGAYRCPDEYPELVVKDDTQKCGYGTKKKNCYECWRREYNGK
jgi:hypothetical protein